MALDTPEIITMSVGVSALIAGNVIMTKGIFMKKKTSEDYAKSKAMVLGGGAIILLSIVGTFGVMVWLKE